MTKTAADTSNVIPAFTVLDWKLVDDRYVGLSTGVHAAATVKISGDKFITSVPVGSDLVLADLAAAIEAAETNWLVSAPIGQLRSFAAHLAGHSMTVTWASGPDGLVGTNNRQSVAFVKLPTGLATGIAEAAGFVAGLFGGKNPVFDVAVAKDAAERVWLQTKLFQQAVKKLEAASPATPAPVAPVVDAKKSAAAAAGRKPTAATTPPAKDFLKAEPKAPRARAVTAAKPAEATATPAKTEAKPAAAAKTPRVGKTKPAAVLAAAAVDVPASDAAAVTKTASPKSAAAEVVGAKANKSKASAAVTATDGAAETKVPAKRGRKSAAVKATESAGSAPTADKPAEAAEKAAKPARARKPAAATEGDKAPAKPKAVRKPAAAKTDAPKA